MQAGRGASHNLPNRMRRLGFRRASRSAHFAPGRVAAALFIIVLLLGGGAGCSLLLDYESDPYRCVIDSDCARFTNAACDSVRKQCVPRFPSGGQSDAGSPGDDGGDGGPGALTCEISFDNAARLTLTGPDGGLRPLPEGP